MCKPCQRARVKRRRDELGKNRAYRLWKNARDRAKAVGLLFTVTVEDIARVMGAQCPVYGTPWGTGRNAPSLDRLRPREGYTPKNIAVISVRANAIKSDANAEQVLRVYKWMRKKGL
jgi:hypothetical protein